MNPLKMHKAIALLVAHWALRFAGFVPVYEIRRRETQGSRMTAGTLLATFYSMTPELTQTFARYRDATPASSTVFVNLRVTLAAEQGGAAIVCGTFNGRMRATAKAYGTVLTPGEQQ